MARFQPLECPAAQQLAILTQGEESDIRNVQPVYWEYMTGSRWRSSTHFREVLGKEGADIFPVQLAFMDGPGQKIAPSV